MGVVQVGACDIAIETRRPTCEVMGPELLCAKQAKQRGAGWVSLWVLQRKSGHGRSRGKRHGLTSSLRDCFLRVSAAAAAGELFWEDMGECVGEVER